MSRKVLFLSATIYGLIVLVIANWFQNGISGVPKHYHLEYVAEHCSRIPAKHAANIADHIIYDGSIGGAVMIYDVVPGKAGPGAFVVGYTSPIDDFFCLWGVGCPIGPLLENGRCNA